MNIEWRDMWRIWSARLWALALAMPAAWVAIPPDLRAVVPDEWLLPIAWVIGLAGLVARGIPQPKAEAAIAARKAGRKT